MHPANRVAVVAVVIILTAQVSFAEQPQESCDTANQVALAAKRMSVRLALREIAAQFGRNIAVARDLRGSVSVNLECVEFHVALREVLAQVGATYCETEQLVRVARRGQSTCETPRPVVEHVKKRSH